MFDENCDERATSFDKYYMEVLNSNTVIRLT